jgi:hypothetical protein
MKEERDGKGKSSPSLSSEIMKSKLKRGEPIQF